MSLTEYLPGARFFTVSRSIQATTCAATACRKFKGVCLICWIDASIRELSGLPLNSKALGVKSGHSVWTSLMPLLFGEQQEEFGEFLRMPGHSSALSLQLMGLGKVDDVGSWGELGSRKSSSSWVYLGGAREGGIETSPTCWR